MHLKLTRKYEHPCKDYSGIHLRNCFGLAQLGLQSLLLSLDLLKVFSVDLPEFTLIL
jgi:hypothetical protein